ncbi:MAG: hypothetical protein ACJAS3_003480 [Roseivirga sp.]|jgi:hypothetical protein
MVIAARNAASKYLNELVEMHILKFEKVGSIRCHENPIQ